MGNQKKRRAIFDYHRFNADILVLQETHSSAKDEKVWENEWGGKAIYAHGTTAARGIAIFTSKEIYSRLCNIVKCIEGRYIIVDIKEEDKIITLVALYAPNEDNPLFFTNIQTLLRERTRM